MKNADPIAPALKAAAKGGKAKLAKQVGAFLHKGTRLDLKQRLDYPVLQCR